MKIRSIAIAGALVMALGSNAAPAASIDSCQGAFVTRGVCVVLVSTSGPAAVTVNGTAFGAMSSGSATTRVAVRLRNAVTGAVVAQCTASGGSSGLPFEINCGRTVQLTEPAEFVGLCEGEGMIAGRFSCDVV